MTSYSSVEPDSDAAQPTDSFTWTSPGAPLRVNIRFSLISRLQTELSRQVEIGGVLLGRKGRAPATVELRDFIRIGSANPSDGPYTLNVSELERLRQTDSGLEEHPAHGSGLFCNWYAGLSVVGYFRTQSKDVLRLRDAEIELVRKRFPDPTSVVLLIETGRQQNEAGFFFPNTSAPSSVMNFPFDATVLQQRTAPHLMEPPAHASEELEEEPEIGAHDELRGSLGLRTRLAAPVMVRTLAGLSQSLTRARWVPSRTLLATAGAKVRTLAGLSTSLFRACRVRSRALLATAGAKARTLASFSTPLIRAYWVRSRALLATAGAKARTLAGLSKSQFRARGVPSRSLLATAGALLMLIALGAFLLPRHASPTSKRSVAAHASFPFPLSVQAQGNGVDVRWDPQSAPLAGAHEGRLLITAPRRRPQTVTLDPNQLASGHVYYRSSTKDLTFRLDIIGSADSIASSSSISVNASPTTITQPHMRQVRTRPEHILDGAPQSVPIASAKAPDVGQRASRNDVSAPYSVERVVTTLPAVPSVDQIRIGAERRDITEKFGAPALSTETMVRGHVIETMVYGPYPAHAQTIISLEDGKVFSTSSR